MPKRESPSLRDVARSIGVHFTTVSLAMRGDPRISADTRKRVQDAAEKLGYKFNPLVSDLISELKRSGYRGQLGTLGFLDCLSGAKDVARKTARGHPFFDGAERRAEDLGYRLDLLMLHGDGMTARRMNSIVRARGIQGLIVDAGTRPRGHLSIDCSPCACVMRGYSNLRPNLHRVCHNHFQGVLLALHHLRHRGYRRIGFAMARKADLFVNNQWSAGYVIHQQHLRPKERVPILLADEPIRDRVVSWLRRWKPDAVVGNDARFADWVKSAGLAVPRDIGFANLDLDSWPGTTQAGIQQGMERIGAAAVESVIAQLQRHEYGIPTHPKLTLLEGAWRDGESVRGRASSPAGGVLP